MIANDDRVVALVASFEKEMPFRASRFTVSSSIRPVGPFQKSAG